MRKGVSIRVLANFEGLGLFFEKSLFLEPCKLLMDNHLQINK
jgi:hypothetical protein